MVEGPNHCAMFLPYLVPAAAMLWIEYTQSGLSPNQLKISLYTLHGVSLRRQSLAHQVSTTLHATTTTVAMV